jgi:hypothetical protein
VSFLISFLFIYSVFCHFLFTIFSIIATRCLPSHSIIAPLSVFFLFFSSLLLHHQFICLFAKEKEKANKRNKRNKQMNKWFLLFQKYKETMTDFISKHIQNKNCFSWLGLLWFSKSTKKSCLESCFTQSWDSRQLFCIFYSSHKFLPPSTI